MQIFLYSTKYTYDDYFKPFSATTAVTVFFVIINYLFARNFTKTILSNLIFYSITYHLIANVINLRFRCYEIYFDCLINDLHYCICVKLFHL